MHHSGNRFRVKHKNVRSNKERDGVRSFVGKENKTECTFLQSKDLYSAANDPRPQMIPRPEMIPKLDRK